MHHDRAHLRKPSTPGELGFHKCPGCGSTRLRLVRCDGPHWGRRDCLDGGRRGPWLKSPWTCERAVDFVLPFGKNRGRTIGELARSGTGRSYLRWLAENVEGNAGIAAKIALGLLEPDDGGRL